MPSLYLSFAPHDNNVPHSLKASGRHSGRSFRFERLAVADRSHVDEETITVDCSGKFHWWVYTNSTFRTQNIPVDNCLTVSYDGVS